MTLWSFSVAGPVLDLLGTHAQFFVAHDSRPVDLVVFTVILCAGFPALLWLTELALGLVSAPASRHLHTVWVTFLAAAVALQLLRKIDVVPGALWLVAALLIGIVAADIFGRFAIARTYLTWLTPAPLVFASVFLGLTPVAKLLKPAPYTPVVDVEISSRTPVVLVVFDELSLPTLMDENLNIDADRFPHFADLSRRSYWYPNTTTTAGFTPIAVPAILTGRYLRQGFDYAYLATHELHPRNLFELLAPEYRLHAFETVTSLCPRALCGPRPFDNEPGRRIRYLLRDITAVLPHAVLPKDLASELSDITDQWKNFNNPWQTRKDMATYLESHGSRRLFDEFLGTLRGAERQALYFLHSSLPHAPWRYLPSGQTYGLPGQGLLFNESLSQGTWSPDNLAVERSFQRYMLQLGYVDRLLGELICVLQEADLWESSLLVVTADHGVSFHSGKPRRRLDESNLHDILRVPLFIKLPYQKQGEISDRIVESVDILPTLAEVLGLPERPWPMHGISVFDPLREHTQHTAFNFPFRWDSFRKLEPTELAGQADAIADMQRLFGRGEDPLALYRIGPHPELVGQRLAELDLEAETRGELHLLHPRLYDAVDLASDFLPARIVGEIRKHGLKRGSLDLAIAVEGTVRSVTRTYSNRDDSAKFTAMVPDSSFRTGRNQVEIFIVTGGEEALHLTPTASTRR